MPFASIALMLCLSLMSATGYADINSGYASGYEPGYAAYAGYASWYASYRYEPGYDYEFKADYGFKARESQQLADSDRSGIKHVYLFREQRPVRKPVRNTFTAMKKALEEVSDTLEYTLSEMMRMVESRYYGYAYDGYDSSPGSGYDDSSDSGDDSLKLYLSGYYGSAKYNAMKEGVKELSVALFSMFGISETLKRDLQMTSATDATDATERTAFASFLRSGWRSSVLFR